MHVRTVVVGLGLLAAGLYGCSPSDSDVARSTTTTVSGVAPSSTTTMPPGVPGSAAVPEGAPRRHGRLRERPPRTPRVTRMEIRAQLAEWLAARRPDHQFTPAEIDQLTNKAMQIRVMRARIERMRPAAQQTPRADAMRARLDVLLDEFQTRAGVRIGDLPPILQPAPPPPRR